MQETETIQRSVSERIGIFFEIFGPELLIVVAVFALASWRSRLAYVLVPLGAVAAFLHITDFYEPTIYGAMEADLGSWATPSAWALAFLYVCAPAVGGVLARRREKRQVRAAA
jgi:uncharacterized membrane protein YuzA (DUF378 family)